eukprot:6481890-Amphidinium_carterae.1
MTNWTGGSLELETVSDALRRLDRRSGGASATKEIPQSCCSRTTSRQMEIGVKRTSRMLPQKQMNLTAPYMYHLREVAQEQLQRDQGDDQIVYVTTAYAALSEISEDQAVAVYANYQQVRAQLHSNTLNRGYYDRATSIREVSESQGGKASGHGKSQYQAYPFRTRLSELIARTKCARCGERGHWARSCTNKSDGRNPQGVYWLQGEERRHSITRMSEVYALAKVKDVYAIEYHAAEFIEVYASEETNEVCAPEQMSVIHISEESTEIPSNLALIHTSAESGVMGTQAKERLTNVLAARSMTPQRVKSARTSASGVGGRVTIEEVLQFPIGVAGQQGMLRAAILPDPENKRYTGRSWDPMLLNMFTFFQVDTWQWTSWTLELNMDTTVRVWALGTEMHEWLVKPEEPQ